LDKVFQFSNIRLMKAWTKPTQVKVKKTHASIDLYYLLPRLSKVGLGAGQAKFVRVQVEST